MQHFLMMKAVDEMARSSGNQKKGVTGVHFFSAFFFSYCFHTFSLAFFPLDPGARKERPNSQILQAADLCFFLHQQSLSNMLIYY